MLQLCLIAGSVITQILLTLRMLANSVLGLPQTILGKQN